MHRIDVPSAAVALPTPAAAGTPGYFTQGNPLTATAATIVDQDFMNAVQEELAAVIEAAGITLDKTQRNQLLAALTGRLIGVRVVNVVGTSVYTPTAGTKTIMVELVGGGAAGGGAAATGASQCAAGAGGGAGGFAFKRITSAFSGVTLTVGAAGLPSVGAAGGNGGSTSFGAIFSATGGTGGTLGAAASAATVNFVGNGPGGTGSSGDVNGVGGCGSQAFYAVSPLSGKGGASVYGDGALAVSGTANGAAGTTPGSGGSGGSLAASQAAANGGSGRQGQIIIREYS